MNENYVVLVIDDENDERLLIDCLSNHDAARLAASLNALWPHVQAKVSEW